MRLITIHSTFLIMLAACASTEPSLGELEGRLMALPERPHLVNPKPTLELLGTEVPDVRGDLVLVLGDRVAVRLTADSQPVPDDRAISLAICSDSGYLGEVLVVEVFRGHALGRILLQKRQFEPGNHATSRM
jgi:hypothetical protein